MCPVDWRQRHWTRSLWSQQWICCARMKEEEEEEELGAFRRRLRDCKASQTEHGLHLMNPIPLSHVTNPPKYQTGSAARIHNDTLKPVCAQLQNKLIKTCGGVAQPARYVWLLDALLPYSFIKSHLEVGAHIRSPTADHPSGLLKVLSECYWKQQHVEFVTCYHPVCLQQLAAGQRWISWSWISLLLSHSPPAIDCRQIPAADHGKHLPPWWCF